MVVVYGWCVESRYVMYSSAIIHETAHLHIANTSVSVVESRICK